MHQVKQIRIIMFNISLLVLIMANAEKKTFIRLKIQNMSIRWNHVYVYKQLFKSFAPYFVLLNLLPDAIG